LTPGKVRHTLNDLQGQGIVGLGMAARATITPAPKIGHSRITRAN
jgi:hypothetical protein